MARRGFHQVRDDATGEHARKLKGDWRKMTDKYMLEDAQLAPMVTLKMDDNWAEFALRYVVDYKRRRSTKDKICSHILKFIEESEGQIQLGVATYKVASIPQLNVKFKKNQE